MRDVLLSKNVIRGAIGLMTVSLLLGYGVSGVAPAFAESLDVAWEKASTRSDDGFEWTVYVEAEQTPGRPAFRVDAQLEAPPAVAARTLMASMSEEGATTSGETRKLLERTPNGALVHTFIDLPFMFADRELAVRIDHRRDAETGIHRVLWRDENENLPEPAEDVLRLASEGYWEFRPAPSGGTEAIYVSRAEVGGSLPTAVGDRLMKGQAVEAVQRLHRLIAERDTSADLVGVAAPPPSSAREVDSSAE